MNGTSARNRSRRTLRCAALNAIAVLASLLGAPATSADFRSVGAAYPRVAYERGWVYLEFAVRADGTAEEIHVLASEPAGVFNEAAVNAVAKSRFEPDPSSVSGTTRRRTLQLEWHFDDMECVPSNS